MSPSLLLRALSGSALFVLLAAQAQAAVVASYSFNKTLAADQAGAPALVAIDPLGLNQFETAIVHGQAQNVYRWSGNGASAATQAGLTLDASALAGYSSYSLALTFEFSALASTGSGWRRIVDTEGRASDNGLYVSPDALVQTVQDTQKTHSVLTSGVTPFSTPGFHDLLLNVSPLAGELQLVEVWLDGLLEISTTTDTFNLNNANNPGQLLTLFADNNQAGAQEEYANGRIASLVLSGTPASVPEPAPALLLALALASLALQRRRAGR